MDGYGNPNGLVRIITNTGQFYEGYVSSFGSFNGFGRMIYNDGSSYIGYYKNNLKHGNGMTIYENNIEYLE